MPVQEIGDNLTCHILQYVSAVIHSYRCYLLFISFVPNLKVPQSEYAIARDG